jgi:hypothetical protein
MIYSLQTRPAGDRVVLEVLCSTADFFLGE